MTDRFYYDPAEENERQAQFDADTARWEAHMSKYKPADAFNLAAAIRINPAIGPDVGAAFASSGAYRWDEHSISTIAAIDHRQQSWLQSILTGVLGPVTRPIFAQLFDIYDQGLAKPIREVTRLTQGQSGEDAFVKSGLGLHATALASYRRGEGVTLGEGILPGTDRDPLTRTGASDVLLDKFDQGIAPQQAIAETEQWVIDNHATNVYTRGRIINESTMFHAQKDGVTIAYHVTPGRAVLQPLTKFIEPETMPWNMLTAFVDGFLQIAGDPLNPVIRKLARIAKVRNKARAPVDKAANTVESVAEDLGGIKIREPVDVKTKTGAPLGPADRVRTAGPIAFHASQGQLPGGALPTGSGVTRNLDEALEFLGSSPHARLNVFGKEDLPDAVARQLGEATTVEYVADASLARAFPEWTAEELGNFQRAYHAAIDLEEDARKGLKNLVGEELFDDIELLMDAIHNPTREGLEALADASYTITDDLNPKDVFGQWRSRLDESVGPERAARIDEYLEQWGGAATEYRDNPIFGSLADIDDVSKAQVARLRAESDLGTAVYGFSDDPLKPSAVFSNAEAREMERIGYFFRTRDQWDTMKYYLDELADAGAVQVKSKWMENPETWERWVSDPKKGGKIVRLLANNEAFFAHRLLPGMSDTDIAYIGLTDSTERITKVLKGWYGSPQSRFKVPRLGRPERGMNALRNGANNNGSNIWQRGGQRVSQYGRRLLSQMGDSAFDPYNLSTNYEIIRNRGDLYGASPESMNKAYLVAMDDTAIIEAHIRIAHDTLPAGSERLQLAVLKAEAMPVRSPDQRMMELTDITFDWMRADLKRLGHTDEYIEEIISTWRKTVVKNKQYNDNAAAQPLALKGATGRTMVSREGEETTLMASEALLDSLLTSNHYFIPSAREARRVTAKMRTLTEYVRARRGKDFIGIDTSTSQAVVDKGMAVWRNLALLRLGWPMRIIPEEMARFYAYGYSDIAQNPFAILAMTLGKTGDEMPNGESLRHLYEATGLGADNGLFHGLDDLGYFETSQRGANWNSTDAVVRHADNTVMVNADGYVTLTDDGAKGIARHIIQLNNAELAQVIMRHNTLDDAMDFLLETVEGREILWKIAGQVSQKGSVGRATSVAKSARQTKRNMFTDSRDLLKALDDLVEQKGVVFDGATQTELRLLAYDEYFEELTLDVKKIAQDMSEKRAKAARPIGDEPPIRTISGDDLEGSGFADELDEFDAGAEVLDNAVFTHNDIIEAQRLFDVGGRDIPDMVDYIPAAIREADQYKALRQLLGSIDASLTQYSGGKWVKMGDDGIWRNQYGQIVETYVMKDVQKGIRWTIEELRDQVAERGIKGPRGGRVNGTLKELRAKLLVDDSLPPDLPITSADYIITQKGLPETRNFIRHGQYGVTADEGFEVLPEATTARRASRNVFAKESKDANRTNYLWVIRRESAHPGRAASPSLDNKAAFDNLVKATAKFKAARKGGATGAAVDKAEREFVEAQAALQKAKSNIPSNSERSYRDLVDATADLKPGESVYAIEKESLPPSVFVGGKGSQKRIDIPLRTPAKNKGGDQWAVSKQAVDDEAVKIVDDNTVSYIHDDMSYEDLKDLEARVKNMYHQDNMPVERVTVPDRPYINPEDEKGLIDAVFRGLGYTPSMFAVRRPFVTLRTWEILADHAVTGTPAIRRQIIATAKKTNMGPRFETFMDDALQARGWKTPTQLEHAIDDIDEIVEMAWTQAVEDTKNLFYDLTKGGAWQDATRLVYPFADAWWEVLSRWSKLVNPLEGGGALKLARRGSQIDAAAESSGWYDYNTQGERTFQFPGSAALFNIMNPDSSVGFLPQVTLGQLTFVDFGDPSQAGTPGLSPAVQVLASAFRWAVPTGMKPFYDAALFRGYSPPEISVEGVVGAFMPTWIRRAFATLSTDAFERKYAGMRGRTLNVLAATASQDVATNQDFANDIEEKAQGFANFMSIVEVFTAFMSPAQPQNTVALIRWDEDGNETIKSAGALGADWAMLQSYYGQDQAMEYFIAMYDIDPLKFAPTTWASQHHPVTREATLFLEDHKEVITSMPYTLMMWIPDDDGEFYGDGWDAQFQLGIRERLNANDTTNYMSHIAGQHRMAALRERRDKELEAAEARYGGTNNDAYRYIRDEVVTPWYNLEKYNISLQYWGWDPKGTITGLTARPTYRKVFNELREIAKVGSDASIAAIGTDPELQEFVVFLVGQWDIFSEYALTLGKGDTWWQTSKSEKNGAPALRALFVQGLNDYIDGLAGQPQERAEWMSNTLIAPLLEGYDWDDPIILAPTVPSSEQVGYADKLGERG